MGGERLEELRGELVSYMEGQSNKAGFEELVDAVQGAKSSPEMAGVVVNTIEYAPSFLFITESHSNTLCSTWLCDPAEDIPLSFLWALDGQDVSSPVRITFIHIRLV